MAETRVSAREGRPCECPGRHAPNAELDGPCGDPATWEVVISRGRGAARRSVEHMCADCAELARRLHREDVFSSRRT